MRSLVLLVAGLLAGCGRDTPKPITATADSASARATSSTSPPTLTYEEGRITFAFWPSGAVRITVPTATATRSCDSELGENGNIWTKSDLKSALDDPDVKSALARRESYRSGYPTPGRLVASGGTISWVTEWTELPPPEPKGVHHLQEVLHVLLTNRASLCT